MILYFRVIRYQLSVYQLLEISDMVMISDLIGIDDPVFLELSDIY